MKVMCWVKTGYRKQSRAYFFADGIIKEFKHTIRFLLANGDRLSIKRNDIISIEEGA